MKPAEAAILNSREPFRSMLLQLQLLVELTLPEAKLLFKWGIPYFYWKGKIPLVYLHATKEYVDLGFARGFELHLHQDKLVAKNRNTVKSLRFYSEEEIDQEVVQELLLEARGLMS